MISISSNVTWRDDQHGQWTCLCTTRRCRYIVERDEESVTIKAPGLDHEVDLEDLHLLRNVEDPEAISHCLVALIEAGELE